MSTSFNDDFAVLILTHGRPDDVSTVRALKNSNYTGRTFFVLDDQDETADQYREKYGADRVIVFNKKAVAKKIDTMDNFGKMGVILYARVAAFEVARELGLKYFVQLDDDYTNFQYRYLDAFGELTGKVSKSLDKMFELMIGFMERAGALTVAFSQGGDFIGGARGGRFKKGILRKAMNSFFCRVGTEIDFRGTMNEDVTMYVTLGTRGERIFSITDIALDQKASQSLTGGMTEIYQDGGTYLKSFYSVMAAPSCVKIASLNDRNNARIHHRVSWGNVSPKIIREEYKKVADGV